MVAILTAVCAAGLLLFFLLLPGESTAAQRAPFWGRNIAHRGLHTKDQSVPENSIPAFTAAVDADYAIELDLRLSRDGEVVVFHDDDLSRACGAGGRVEDTDWAELRDLRLFGTEYRMPRLAEALAVVDCRCPLVIEVKTCPRWQELCESAWRILRQYDGDICVESFDPRMLRWFMKHTPGLLRGQLAAPPATLQKGAQGLAVGWLLTNCLCRPQFIAYQKGKKPLVARLVGRLAMQVVWTARPGDDTAALEAENDAVIFEFYEPEPRYRAPIEEVDILFEDPFEERLPDDTALPEPEEESADTESKNSET